MTNISESQAQHLFIYKDKTQKLVAVMQEMSNVYYYHELNDSFKLTKAVFKDELREVIKLDSSKVDSTIQAINLGIMQDSIKYATEMKKVLKFSCIPAVSSSFRSDQFNYNISVSYTLLYQNQDMLGLGLGYERLNKGQSFLVTNSIQARVFYNKFFSAGFNHKPRMYAGVEFSIARTIGGMYNLAWTSENRREEQDLAESHLTLSKGIKALLGVAIKDKYLIDIGLINRNIGISYPTDNDEWYFLTELRFGYKL
jgi:hypothetical protein